MIPLPEPYRVKMIEPIRLLAAGERRARLAEAGYNTFLLRSEDVYIDLLTDSGTNAMSDAQWSALMRGDEAYAGSRSFEALQAAVRDVYGFPYIVPTHQGRGAEHLLSRSWIRPGQLVPGNMYFTTTRLHQELAGGTFQDVICEEAYEPSREAPFKGNVDLGKLSALVERHGAEKIAYVAVGAPVNMAGGQPVSLGNLEQVWRFCQARGIRVVLDGARAVENAYFIQQREPGCSKMSVARILREMCLRADACLVSAKKDLYVNIGGFLATRDRGLYEKAMNLCVVYEGLHTYGGLAGRDLEAMAVGAREMVQDDWIAHRVGQVRALGERLRELGVPIVKPIGGHGVFLDARAFLPHLSQDELPAQSLAAWLYEECGVRAMERGVVSSGRGPDGRHRYPKLELVRLTLPRRVYSDAQLAFVAEGVGRLFKRRAELPGLRFVSEPELLRFFQSRFEPLPVAARA
ncbi:MAG: tryptophanase [Elusimicrobia bacterium]|nr:tryptophanase [Elusimicrobiota bacterium]MDE2236727.1 tryptophanase [Elusimicrobiota bacterium]MDE2426119.1 tryptophanase [Elusimicrobiota bacterium]